MNTRCKFQYKSGLYFLNFPSNVNKETIFTDGFESMSTWDKTNNSFGHSLTALDTTKKKSGSYSGRIDDNYPRQWSKYVYSDTWTPINNSQDTYYTVSGWVYVEDVTTNGSLPNLAKLWIVTRKQGERGYPTGHISTSSTKEGTWEYLSKTVLIPADVKEINVRIENARLGKVWFDDVKIVKGNTSQTVIVEESNYYPFGLQHKGYNNVVSSNGNSTAQKIKFGGKEYQDELGLEWYDVSARNYDPALGRWMNLDPLAEQMRRHSPYNYAFDNPIYFIDPDGMAPIDFMADFDDNQIDPIVPEVMKRIKDFFSPIHILYSLADFFNLNSDDDSDDDSKKKEKKSKIHQDGIVVYGVGGEDSPDANGKGNDRGKGSVKIGMADINPVYFLLGEGIKLLNRNVNYVTNKTYTNEDIFLNIDFASDSNGKNNVIWITGYKTKIQADSAANSQNRTPLKSRSYGRSSFGRLYYKDSSKVLKNPKAN